MLDLRGNRRACRGTTVDVVLGTIYHNAAANFDIRVLPLARPRGAATLVIQMRGPGATRWVRTNWVDAAAARALVEQYLARITVPPGL